MDSIWDRSKEWGLDQFDKGKRQLQHAAGLGAKPNAVPPGEVDIRCEPREVEVGWHPVAGLAGKWFAEQTGIGKQITEHTNKYPDPTQHWGVLVGGYVHQLWMDEELDVIYINEELKPDEWHTFSVGKTRFNDEALRQAGELTIHEMREKRAGYHLIENNCQNFASNLLSKIQIGHHREFATALAVYNNAFSASQLKGLFDDHPDDDPEQRPEGPEEGTVGLAEKVMDEQTNKIAKE
ncbi:hypothetical protein Micbo1qcDRAFT_237624 [Microdochium bolleyi]|uniref:PPPDE domain-containing protein n=1 Tax=Microdochium bolleyi TaxID=196109 RepID=A0A136IIZ4_9PEZI|nr:hypothetical protein Micbo1qcDRAFT_237624 [Microdochium bolleyi]